MRIYEGINVDSRVDEYWELFHSEFGELRYLSLIPGFEFDCPEVRELVNKMNNLVTYYIDDVLDIMTEDIVTEIFYESDNYKQEKTEAHFKVLPVQLSDLREMCLKMKFQVNDLKGHDFICLQGSEGEPDCPIISPIYSSQAMYKIDMRDASVEKIEGLIRQDLKKNKIEKYTLKDLQDAKDDFKKGLVKQLTGSIKNFIENIFIHWQRKPSLYNVKVHSLQSRGTLEKTLAGPAILWTVAPGGYTPTVDTVLDPATYRFRVGVGTGSALEDSRCFPITHNGQEISLQV